MIASASDFPIELMGRYRLIGKLGSGTGGVVFRAHDVNLKKDVAIKTLVPGAENRSKMVRFQKEAKTLARLTHRNLVRLLDFGVTETGKAYMVMEFVEGKPLDALIAEQGRMPLQMVLEVFLQILAGIGHAHKHGVVHRDLKCSNVMLEELESKTPVVRLIDFGIAQLRDPNEQKGFVSTSKIAGSPAYMSPEASKGETDIRSDVYSLGCLLFECLVGRTPFVSSTLIEMTNMHANEPPPQLVEFAEDESDEEWMSIIQPILDRALAKDPKDRFQTVDELSHAIVTEAEKLPIEVPHSATTGDVTDRAIGSNFAENLRRALPVSRRLSRKAILILAAVLLVPLCLYAGMILMGESKINEEKDTSFRVAQTIGKDLDDDRVRVGMFSDTVDKIVHSQQMSITDQGLQKYTGRSGRFDLAQSGITDSGIKHLYGKRVHILDVAYTKLTEAGIDEAIRIPGLAELKIDGLPVTAKSLKELRNSKIIKLSVMHTSIGDDALEEIGRMPYLKSLRLNGCKNITDRGMKYLQPVANSLYNLDAEHTGISSRGVLPLTKLQYLSLAYLKTFSDEDLKKLAVLKELSALDLSGSHITSRGLQELLVLPKLAWMGTAECPHLTARDMELFRIKYKQKHGRALVFEADQPYQGLKPE